MVRKFTADQKLYLKSMHFCLRLTLYCYKKERKKERKNNKKRKKKERNLYCRAEKETKYIHYIFLYCRAEEERNGTEYTPIVI